MKENNNNNNNNKKKENGRATRKEKKESRSKEKKEKCEKVGVMSSSAEGSMIEKYSNNLLGAEVFPHSNWMNPVIQYNEPYSGADGEAFECGDMLNDL